MLFRIPIVKGVHIFMVLSKIKGFFQNKWTKRCVSIFSPAFLIVVLILAYMSLVYTVEITNFKNFAIAIGIFVGVLAITMIYSRKTFLTSLVSMIVLPLLFPIVINCWGEWILIIPLAVLAVLMFFMCGAGENLKTVLGTIYITFFILGTIAYLLYNSLIVNQTYDQQSEYYVSENGNYRCYVIDTIDSSTGGTKVYVEPNTYDINYNGISFIATDYEKIVYNIRERKNVKIEWRKDNLFIDNELRFRSKDAEDNDWFVFLDYKTRINNIKTSTEELINTVCEKFFDKTIFDLPEDLNDEDTVPMIDIDEEYETDDTEVTTVTTTAEDEDSENENSEDEDDENSDSEDDDDNQDDDSDNDDEEEDEESTEVTTTKSNAYAGYFD